MVLVGEARDDPTADPTAPLSEKVDEKQQMEGNNEALDGTEEGKPVLWKLQLDGLPSDTAIYRLRLGKGYHRSPLDCVPPTNSVIVRKSWINAV